MASTLDVVGSFDVRASRFLASEKSVLILTSLTRLIGFPRCWQDSYEPFSQIGADTFLMVLPSYLFLWTCEGSVITQMLQSNGKFDKPVESLKALNVFGPTLGASAGEEARTYRKVAAKSFNEESYESVFVETVSQVEAWFGNKILIPKPLKEGELGWGVGMIALSVVSKLLYGRSLKWKELQQNVASPSKDQLSYSQAITGMANNLQTFFMILAWLRRSPFLGKRQKAAVHIFEEWLRHMKDLVAQKRLEIKNESGSSNPNLLESFIQAGDASTPLISQPAIYGNAFVFLLAGHETSANVLHFAIVTLACHPHMQRALQTSLDSVVDNIAPLDWSYKTMFPALYRTYTGAVISETMRVYPALPFLLRTTGKTARALTVDEQSHLIPPETLIWVNIGATHNNPRVWKGNKPVPWEHPPFPLSNFDPSRWLDEKGEMRSSHPDGTYIPFSTGPRGCIGSRFALVEMCAVLARVFKEFSVELAAEQDVEDLGVEERRKAWERCLKHAEQQLSNGVNLEAALKMKRGVKLSIVRRGQEMWQGL